MFINAVQKAQSLFKDYSQVESYPEAKQMALANPIFSWHVKYLIHRRKKVVIFTNDASTLTVILYDINAKNRSELKEKFQQQLALVWESLGLSQDNLDEYLQVAGDWQISKTVNRSQRGRLDNVSSVVEIYLDDNFTDDLEISKKMSVYLRGTGSGDYLSKRDVAPTLKKENLKWHQTDMPETVETDTAHLKDIRDQLADIVKSVDGNDYDDPDKLDRKVMAIGKLNDELIDAFITNVHDSYSEKTLKEYQKSLKFYLNEYLAFYFITVFNDEASGISKLYRHGVSMTETKRTKRSLSRFYKFLADEKIIDVKFSKQMKSELLSEMELVQDTFDAGYY